jgi:hypothetical protein
MLFLLSYLLKVEFQPVNDSGAITEIKASPVIGGSLLATAAAPKRGLLIPLHRVAVSRLEFEPTIPDFADYVEKSWQAKFDTGGNSYLLTIDQCAAEPWMVGDLYDQCPGITKGTAFFMIKFDNVVNGILGTTYDLTPKNDTLRKRLTDDGLEKLFSHLTSSIEIFGRQFDVQLFVACAGHRSLERLYRYLLTRIEVVGYDSSEFLPANGQAHFAFIRKRA